MYTSLYIYIYIYIYVSMSDGRSSLQRTDPPRRVDFQESGTRFEGLGLRISGPHSWYDII